MRVTTMHVDDLIELYDYCYWANGRLLGALTPLTPEEFTRDVGGSYGSIRNTLVHALSAEWGWLDRCGGPPRGPKLDPAHYPTVASLAGNWAKVEHEMRAFLATLRETDLEREVRFAFGGPESALPVGKLLWHAALHGIHHRGQASLLMRMVGHAPGNVDMLIYLGEGSPPKS